MKHGLFMYTEAGDKKEPLQWVLDMINKVPRDKIMAMLYKEEYWPAIIECYAHFEKKYGKDCLF